MKGKNPSAMEKGKIAAISVRGEDAASYAEGKGIVYIHRRKKI